MSKLPAGNKVPCVRMRAGNPNLPVPDLDDPAAKFILAWDAPVSLDKAGEAEVSRRAVRAHWGGRGARHIDITILDDGVEITASHEIVVLDRGAGVVKVKFNGALGIDMPTGGR